MFAQFFEDEAAARAALAAAHQALAHARQGQQTNEV